MLSFKGRFWLFLFLESVQNDNMVCPSVQLGGTGESKGLPFIPSKLSQRSSQQLPAKPPQS